MTDFPPIEGFEVSTTDPASDFLSRERALLGDEFASAGDAAIDRSASAFPDLDDGGGGLGGGFESISSPTGAAAAAAPRDTSDFVSGFTRDEPSAPEVPAGGAPDELSAFESQYPAIETAAAPSLPHTNGNYAPPEPSQSSVSWGQPQEPESEAMIAWRERQAKEIAERDAASARKKEQRVMDAEKSIDDFYANYNQQKERNIKQNKEEEAVFLQERTDTLGRGTTWQRIADLVDLQDSRSKTNTRSTKDLGRFKEILLSLKREGETAPGAAGY